MADNNADNNKDVAQRLNEFTEAAKCVLLRPPVQTTGGDGRQIQGVYSNPGPSFRERTDVFEDCIAKLGEPDRREFARMLEVMFGVLDSLKGDAS